ncbi:hypothetical protein ABXM53_08240, partial [Enterococcus faecium]
MKPASIPAFVPLLNAKRVNGICPNEIEKLLPIWIGINDNTIANAATIVPSTQTLFFGSILFDVGELHQHLFCIKKYRKDTL